MFQRWESNYSELADDPFRHIVLLNNLCTQTACGDPPCGDEEEVHMQRSRIISMSVFIMVAAFIFGGCASSMRGKCITATTAVGAAAGGGIGYVAGNAPGGAIAGGAVGAFIGDALCPCEQQPVFEETGNTAEDAINRQTLGGEAGERVKRYMRRQADDMRRDLEGARIQQVGEGIKITFDSSLLFAVGSDDVSDESHENLNNLCRILNRYPDTEVLVEGHTDSDGADDMNMALSRRRAESVAVLARENDVAASRITTVGYGETQPIADNSTVEGKARNRRVEIAIYANDQLKRMALSGELR